MPKKLLKNKQWNFIYSKVPRLCVELIIVKDKKILFTKRSIYPFKGLWHLPGGGVLFREKINNALDRIANSELDIKIKQKKFIGYYEVLRDGPDRHSIVLDFQCRISGNKEPRALGQASECKFFKQLPKMIISYHKDFIKKNKKLIFS